MVTRSNATFTDAGEARTYAAMHGLDFDNQDDWCDACSAFHVGVDHNEAVPDQCGVVEIQGYSTVLECIRPAGHDGVHDNGGSSWG